MRMIDFYYDVVCPYAYLASIQVEAVARRGGATVRWRPILLGGLLRTVGAPADPNEAMSPAKRALLRIDRARYAALHGVPLHEPPQHPRRTVEAMRLCLAAPEGPVRRAVSEALFRAYWVQGQDVSDPAVLAAIARSHGLAADAHAAASLRSGLREATAEAAAAGAFGVPSFVVDGRLWWGQDRLPLVERALGSEPPAVVGPPGEPGRSTEPGTSTKPDTSAGPPDRVRFFHDFASPFSYLAATQVERIAAARGVQVEGVPILVGGLFRALGTADVPLFEMNPTKQAYVRRDLDDWAQWWGVPFRFPERFPLRSVLPLRVALASPAATRPIYDAAWGEGRAVDDPAVLGAVLEAAGVDPAAALEQAHQAPIKERLRINTEQASSRGICGVPTFEVIRGDRSVLLWGQDRLALLDAMLAGWDPNVS